MAHNRYFLGASITIMIIAFVVLVSLQITYYAQMADLLEKQFVLSVHRAINQTSKAIEEEEIVQIVHEIAKGNTLEAEQARQIIDAKTTNSLQDIYLYSINSKKENGTGIAAAASDKSNKMSENLATNLNLMYAVFARKYARVSTERIAKSVSHDFIRSTLNDYLHENEVDLDFSFAIKCNKTDNVFQFGVEKPFDINDAEKCYSGRTYSHDGSGRSYDMIVYFPDKKPFLYTQLGLMTPYLVASLILLILCVSTLIYLMRQRELSQIQNDFVRNMTHELKTPVASISLAAQMLSDQSIEKPEEMTARMCSTIKNESKRLVLLIDSVLQTSVLEQRGSIENPSPLDVHDIIQSARNNLMLKAACHNGEIRLFLEADDFIIEGDETHFTNIIFNLIENAIKYASPERDMLLEIRTYNQNNRLFIEISDNGIGIDRQYMPHIFKKYYRVPTGDRHDIKGFGLGLAYVHNMVHRHKGHISVESQVNIGTRFTIDLPIYTE